MHLKKKIIFLVVLVACNLAAVNSAHAQGGDVYNSTGQGQSVACRGERDFATAGVTIWNQFMDPMDFFEYWNDITVRYFRNFCYYEDIYSLIKRIDKARTQIRKAFYDCAMTEGLKITYYELEAELYFLRHYVDENDYYIKPIDEDWYKFTSGIYGERDNRVKLFNKFHARYTNRLETYKECKDPGIENMIATYNSDMDYLKQTVANFKKGISQKASRLAKTASSLWNSIKTGEYLSNLVEVRINGMSCPVLGYLTAPTKSEEDKEKKEEKRQECLVAVDQLLVELRRQMPGSVTVYDLQDAYNQIKHESERIKEETVSMAEFEFKYKDSSDNMLDQFTGRLDGLKQTIQDTYAPETQTINCVKFIGKSQCQNILGVVSTL